MFRIAAALILKRSIGPALILSFMLHASGVALAADHAKKRFDLEAGNAEETLKDFAVQAGREIMFPTGKVAGVNTHPVSGTFTPIAALERMLANTGLYALEDPRTGALMVSTIPEPEQSGRESTLFDDPSTPDQHSEPAMKKRTLIAIIAGWISQLAPVPVTAAQNGPAGAPPASVETGSIFGRIQNITSGTYLGNARVTVAGTTLETFTNDSGEFRLTRVPAGEVVVTAFFTGLDEYSAIVTVPAGGVVRHDIEMDRVRYDESGERLELGAFVVEANREYHAQAIAINEQRFAPNLKTVASTDEYGDTSEGNLGDFIKFMPGVDVDYSAGTRATSISVRGFPANATEVSMDGADIANANVNRSFDLQGFQAFNNIARIEVIKSPTPDIPASLLGGRVNLISKTAFERPQKVFNYRVGATHSRDLPTGGLPSNMGEGEFNTVRPHVDFGYVVPVSKNFGFTLSGAHISRLMTVDIAQSTWDLNRLVLDSFQISNSTQQRDATSGGVTVDWRVAERHVFSGSLTYVENRSVSPITFHQANLGANQIGDATFAESTRNTTAITRSGPNLDRHLKTWRGALKYGYDGPVWQVDGIAHYSLALRKDRPGGKFAFSHIDAFLPAVRIRLDDIGLTGRPGPGTISATTAAGVPVDVWDANNYQLRTLRRVHHRNDLTEVVGGQVNVTRHLDLQVPVVMKTGVFINRRMSDLAATQRRWTFLGPDGVANNADNVVGNYDFIGEEMSKVPVPYGFPAAQRLSSVKVHEYFLANPEQFREDEVFAIRGRANGSRKIIETISAAYVRGDIKLMNNRLVLVGGVRFEHTENEGEGVLNDPRAALVQDSNGNLVLDSEGSPIPVTTDPVERARLEFTERGAHNQRSYSGFYPSFNASYSITENTIARFAYARTIGRPNWSFIIPGVQVSDPEAEEPFIRVSNPGLLPWTANAFDLSLERYLASNGVVSVGVFTKDVSNFFSAITTEATPELLESHGLPTDLVDHEWRTTTNVGDAQMSGLEINYRQALTFLPAWAQGIQVFGNGTFNRLKGEQEADFSGFAKRTFNYGISISRPRFTAKLSWNSKGWVRGAFQAPNAKRPEDTYFWLAPRTVLDASIEIRLNRHFSVYATATNLTNRRYRREKYAPDTPEFAWNQRYLVHGTRVTVGIKGEF